VLPYSAAASHVRDGRLCRLEKKGRMSAFRKTHILIVIVAALAAFTIFDGQRLKRSAEITDIENHVLKKPVSDWVKIEMGIPESPLTLERRKDKDAVHWYIASHIEPAEEPVDEQSFANFVGAIRDEKITEPVAVVKDPSTSLGLYGLDHPVAFIKITDTFGGTQEVRFGSVKAYDGSLYAEDLTSGKIELVSGSWAATVSKLAREFRDKRIYRGGADGELAQISILNLGSAIPVGAVFRKTDQTWDIVGAVDGAKPGIANSVSSSLIDIFVGQIKVLHANDIAASLKTDTKDLERLGLSHPLLRIELKNKDGRTFTLSLSSEMSTKLGQRQLTSVFATSSDAAQIFSLDASALHGLDKRAVDFFDPKGPFQFKADQVQAVRIETPKSAPAATGDYQKTGDQWYFLGPTQKVGSQEKTKLDSLKFAAFINRLSLLQAGRFFSLNESKDFKSNEKIEFFASDQRLIFAFSWGDLTMRKMSYDAPEMSFLPAKTSLSGNWFALASSTLAGINFNDIVKPATK
jgi:hypothetical protein